MSQVVESKRLSVFSILMIALIALCVLASFALTILMQNGITLIYTGVYYYLPLGAAALLAVWAVYGIVHKCRSGALKFGLSLLVGVVAAVVLIFVYMMLSVYLTYSGSKYAVLTNESGENSAIVMQGYYFDEERVIARHGEDYENKTLPEDMMRDFHAYRLINAFFMDTGAGAEHIYIGEDSEAKLMSEWLDEDTLYLYIENPAEDDRGEITITFE